MSILNTLIAILLLIQCIVALASVLRFALYCRRMRLARPSRYQPKAVVIVPCKGIEHNLEDNIRAYLVQNYRDYEVIFVTESESDPAYGVLSRLVKQNRRASWLVVAGEAQDCGQKVHNLISAIEMLDSIDRRAEVLVFADSDAHPSREWLSELVAPLGDKQVGATTGFRWYLPANNHLASLLLSVWNSSALSLLGERSSFAWGGSMAIRRENFDKLEIKKRWQGAVSDDYVLTAAINEAKQRIKFVPRCLVVSHSRATLTELLEFSTRQLRITRIYAPNVWKFAGATHAFFNLTFWGGLAWVTGASAMGISSNAFTNLIPVVYLLGAITGFIRGWIANGLLVTEGIRAPKRLWAYGLLGPVVSLIYLYNVIASIWTSRIVWREISYELISPQHTVILHRPTQQNPRQMAQSAKQKQGSVRSSSQKR